LELTDLIPVDDLESMRSTFEAAVGIPILFTDADGRPLTPDARLEQFCVAFLTDTGAADRETCLLCGRRTDRENAVAGVLADARRTGRWSVDVCPGMFLDSIVPIHVEGRAIAYAVCGRSLGAPPDLDVYRAVAAENGLDTEAVLEVVKSVPIVPRDKVVATAGHLNSVVNFMVRVADENRRTQREVEMAGHLQQGLTPKEHFIEGFDIAAHLKQSSATGGDLMDAFRLGGGDAVFFAGDVSGHGVPAALVMSLLAGIIGSTRHANVWPAEMLARLNEAFLRHFGERRVHATLFYARYVAAEKTIVYANAGHERPLLIRAGSGTIEVLGDAAGFPLGFDEQPEYIHGRVPMDSGDTLALFTDGLIERRDRAGAWFGPEALSHALTHCCGGPAEEALASVLGALDALADPSCPALDDQGLLLVCAEPVTEVIASGPIDHVTEICKGLCSDLQDRGATPDDLDGIRLALDEGITNAIQHGSAGRDESVVRVRYSLGPNLLKIVIADEGQGIWKSGSKPIAEPHLDGSGYGLALVRQCMDHVEWSLGGTELFMARRLNRPR